jgi:hypothetical protein
VFVYVHRVTVVMLPDQELGAKIESDEKQKLEGLRAAMSSEQVKGGGLLSATRGRGWWVLCTLQPGERGRQVGTTIQQ